MQILLILAGLVLLFNPTWFTGAAVVGGVALGLGVLFIVLPLALAAWVATK